MISGFDVSGNAGSVNFVAARAAGHAFCFMRVGRGVPSSATDAAGLDTRWQTYRTQAPAAGLPYGGYWRFYPNVNMATQVTRFAGALRQAPRMLSPLVDIEDTGGLAPGPLTDWSIAALNAVHKATGRRPHFYTNANFLKTALQQWRLDRWERCLAHWSATAWPDHSAVFWQHKGDVTATWAQGRVDLQRFACRAVDLQAHTREHELVYWVDDDGQLYGPRADWTPLPEGQDERQRATPRRNVLHTMAGWLIRTDEMFRSAAVGVESTFGTGHTVDAVQFNDPALDGQIRQWVECDVIANANLDGDQGVPDIVSFESADGGVQRPLSPKQAYTTWQAMAAVCWRYAIPAVELPDSCEGRSGIGWHRLGITGYPLTGRYRGKRPNCEPWSRVNAKECPWPARIDQIVTVGIPTIHSILTSVAQEGDLSAEEVRQINEHTDAVGDEVLRVIAANLGVSAVSNPAAWLNAGIGARVDKNVRAALVPLLDDEDMLRGALDELPPGISVDDVKAALRVVLAEPPTPPIPV